jgi:hypothetical protein
MQPMVIPLIAIIAFGITLGSFIESSYAQTNSPDTSKQTTLSGDLANNPLAQDILEKIEQTKQWIADLEEREYEKTKAGT